MASATLTMESSSKSRHCYIVYSSVFQPGFRGTEGFRELQAGFRRWPVNKNKAEITMGPSVWFGLQLHLLQCYTHTPVSIGDFLVQITKYRKKCCFCPLGIEQTLVSLHGFREQSKRSEGFRSNKKVEKHGYIELYILWIRLWNTSFRLRYLNLVIVNELFIFVSVGFVVHRV